MAPATPYCTTRGKSHQFEDLGRGGVLSSRVSVEDDGLAGLVIMNFSSRCGPEVGARFACSRLTRSFVWHGTDPN